MSLSTGQRTTRTTIASGASRIPKARWRTDYFHAELAEPAAVAAGVIELSKDGKEWKKLGTRTKAGTGQMHSRLKVDDGWRFARYRNASDKPVSLKIDLFKFDVQGADSPTDFLLEEISR